ncbi:MAG: histidine kinase N-terminal domain-containing protein [Acidimicrobiia bacterium]|nr:histidine kinase N-terminal domain-containing protein [Acidimicrobiia bacterium]
MAAFPELAILRTELSGDALAHLERLAVSWRLLSDLSFSDLLLLAPLAHEDGHRFVVLAQVRPTTGQTLYVHDLVGRIVDEVERPALARSWRHAEVFEGDANILGGKERVRLESIPVRYRGREIAVLAREAPTTSGRRPGELERYYLEVYDRLVSMVAHGSFPFAREEVEIEGAPRVGDGVIVLDADGGMRYASPNAVSSLHRIGIHAYTSGVRLSEIGFDEAAVDTAVRGRLPVLEEVERDEASVLVRVIPLLDAWKPAGALVLLRDVTDLRRRDRMLMSKDATIREIHHRVKNNLQTIASLLRLQGRRVDSREARTALAESERRIRSIAIVHETLSREARESVDFGQIIKQLVRLVEESVSTGDGGLRFEVVGDAGELPGELATPLAVVLNELMQNAVDHAFPHGEDDDAVHGNVEVRLQRRPGVVDVDVVDDGVGLAEGYTLASGQGLGMSIVQALVTGELGGELDVSPGDNGRGTRFHVRIPFATAAATKVVEPS